MIGGLQVFDPDLGITVLDLSDRLTRHKGIFNTGLVNGSVTLGPSGGDYWFIVREIGSWSNLTPDFTLAGGVISWVFPTGNISYRRSLSVVWGEY